jgi:hypothetical protein
MLSAVHVLVPNEALQPGSPSLAAPSPFPPHSARRMVKRPVRHRSGMTPVSRGSDNAARAAAFSPRGRRLLPCARFGGRCRARRRRGSSSR